MHEPCWLAQFADTPCDGRMVRVHLIPQQQIKMRAKTLARENGWSATATATWSAEASADARTWVPGCGGPTGIGGHHGELDHSKTLRLKHCRLPSGTVQIARELGLSWWLERNYEL